MRNRRPRTAATLVAMGVVLLIAIFVGQRIGDKALFGATQRRVPVAGVVATPVADPSAGDPLVAKNWKRLQVVSVATDPAFPDPRVTRPPTPTPTAPPAPRHTPTPQPTPSAPSGVYTSPPLPIPLVSPDARFAEPTPSPP